MLPLHFKGARHPVAPAILFLTGHRHHLHPAGEATPILLPDGQSRPQLGDVGIRQLFHRAVDPAALGNGAIQQQAAGNGTLYRFHLGLGQAETAAKQRKLAQHRLRLLIGIAGQAEGEQLAGIGIAAEIGRVHRLGWLLEQGHHLIAIALQAATQGRAKVADQIGVFRLERQRHPLPDLLLGTLTGCLPQLEQRGAGIGTGLTAHPDLARPLQRLFRLAGVIERLIVHAEQIGGARLGRIEAQELRPLLALGQIGQIAALQPVGLGSIPMLADKASHIVVIRRPRTKGELIVVEIGQQGIMGQTGTNLLETGLIIGPYGVIRLTVERLVGSLRHQGRHKQRRQNNSPYSFH